MSGTRAAVYTRVSTTGQAEDGTSLDTQLERCMKFAADRGWEVIATEQDDESGGSLQRDGLDRLRALAKAGDYDVFLAFKQERISRKQTDTGVLYGEFTGHGVTIWTVQEGEFEQTPIGQFVATVYAFAAEMDLAQRREATMRGRTARIEGGNVPTTGFAGYGFDYVQPTKEQRDTGMKAHRIVVETEAGIVREVFEAVAAGESLRGMAKSLNERGVLSPGSRLRYKEGCSGQWSMTGIRVMLLNPAYKGMTVARRFRMVTDKRKVAKPEDEWTVINETGPAIVDPDLWRIANERLKENRGAVTWNKGQPMLLRGRVVCGECGTTIYAGADKREGRRSVYRCRNKHHDGRPSVNLEQRELDAWVWSETERVLRNRDRVVAAVRAQLERTGDSSLQGEADRLAALAAKLERQKAALIRGFTEAEGEIPWAVIKPEVERLDGEHATAAKALAAVQARIGEDAAETARLDTMDELVRRLGPKLADPDHETRVRVIAELGLTVTATRRWQQLNWSIALADGDESDWAAQIDLTDVEEADEETRRNFRDEQMRESLRDEERQRGAACIPAPAASPAIRSKSAGATPPPSRATRSGSEYRYRVRPRGLDPGAVVRARVVQPLLQLR